jgi:hypothetical protein
MPFEEVKIKMVLGEVSQAKLQNFQIKKKNKRTDD